MGRLLKNILSGARKILVICPENDYVRPQRGAFAQDAKNLRKDAAQITGSLRKKVQSHGKQINHR